MEKNGCLVYADSLVEGLNRKEAAADPSLQNRRPLLHILPGPRASLEPAKLGELICRIRVEPHLMCRHGVQGCLMVRGGRGEDGWIGKRRLETSPGNPPLSSPDCQSPAEFNRESQPLLCPDETRASHLPSRNLRSLY